MSIKHNALDRRWHKSSACHIRGSAGSVTGHGEENQPEFAPKISRNQSVFGCIDWWRGHRRRRRRHTRPMGFRTSPAPRWPTTHSAGQYNMLISNLADWRFRKSVNIDLHRGSVDSTLSGCISRFFASFIFIIVELIFLFLFFYYILYFFHISSKLNARYIWLEWGPAGPC